MTAPARCLPLVPGLALLVLTACTGAAQDQTSPSPPEGSPAPAVGQRIGETVRAELGGVELVLEVADEQQERAVGLMGRTEVPAGTGMLFRFDAPVTSSFYMFQVPVPLVAVFLREGTVVGVEQMEPCTEAAPADCPLYGPDEPYDTVVETAPQTLPEVSVGDSLVVAGPPGPG